MLVGNARDFIEYERARASTNTWSKYSYSFVLGYNLANAALLVLRLPFKLLSTIGDLVLPIGPYPGSIFITRKYSLNYEYFRIRKIENACKDTVRF